MTANSLKKSAGLAALSCLLLIGFGQAQEKSSQNLAPIKIVLVGDSTVALGGGLQISQN